MQRPLFGPLAPALIVFVAACTAAVQDREDRGESSAAIEEPAASAPKAKATAAAGGLTCDIKTMVLPEALPDVATCINDKPDGTGLETGCNKWTKLGPRVTKSAELRSQEDMGAQLYMIRSGGSTLCLYLYRGDAAVTKGSLNGVHCYDEATCDLCWWDARTDVGVKPTVADLKHDSGDDCSSCHRNGPLLPLYTLWTEAAGETMELHNECTKRGGPSWANPMTGPDTTFAYAKPDLGLIENAPAGCGEAGCHVNGFAKGGDYCELISHAFASDGSMRKGEGAKFTSTTACVKFLEDMDCDRGNPKHAVACDNLEVVKVVEKLPAP